MTNLVVRGPISMAWRARPLLVGLATLMLAGATEAVAADPKSVARDASSSVVTIEILSPAKPAEGEAPGAVLLKSFNGSGFVFDREGRIVTNAHVVAGATRIVVRMSDGRRIEAELVGMDRVTDVAVVKVSGDAGAPLELAAGLPEAGEPVVAIGSPYDLAGSVSTGVVSGVRRAVRPSGPDWFVQHTADINPGSSGGPVLDMEGKVVGINTAIPDGQYSFAGISLAIDAPTVAAAAARLIDDGAIVRPRLGASFRAVDAALATALDLEGAGIVVDQVQAGSPAAAAGLKADDLVLSFNGQPTATLSSLLRIAALADQTKQVDLTVRRGGDVAAIAIPPGDVATSTARQVAPAAPVGIVFADGAVAAVAAVEPASLAAAAGIEPGDVVESINLKSVSGAAQARALLAGADTRLIAVRVARGNQPSRIFVLGSVTKDGKVGSNNAGMLNASL